MLCARSMVLASSIPVLGVERISPQKVGPWPWSWMFFVSLASSRVSSTPPLFNWYKRIRSVVEGRKPDLGF